MRKNKIGGQKTYKACKKNSECAMKKHSIKNLIIIIIFISKKQFVMFISNYLFWV